MAIRSRCSSVNIKETPIELAAERKCRAESSEEISAELASRGTSANPLRRQLYRRYLGGHANEEVSLAW